MSDDEIIDAEIVEEDSSSQEHHIVQVTPDLEIERLKTKRAKLATKRTEIRWQASATAIVLSTAFASCAHICTPW